MATDGRKIFVTSIPTNYVSRIEKISQVQKILTNLTTRVNLDIPKDIWLVSKDLNLTDQYNDSQSHKSLPDYYTEEKLYNIGNLLER